MSPTRKIQTKMSNRDQGIGRGLEEEIDNLAEDLANANIGLPTRYRVFLI
jgi:hypothetical protein